MIELHKVTEAKPSLGAAKSAMTDDVAVDGFNRVLAGASVGRSGTDLAKLDPASSAVSSFAPSFLWDEDTRLDDRHYWAIAAAGTHDLGAETEGVGQVSPPVLVASGAEFSEKSEKEGLQVSPQSPDSISSSTSLVEEDSNETGVMHASTEGTIRGNFGFALAAAGTSGPDAPMLHPKGANSGAHLSHDGAMPEQSPTPAAYSGMVVGEKAAIDKIQIQASLISEISQRGAERDRVLPVVEMRTDLSAQPSAKLGMAAALEEVMKPLRAPVAPDAKIAAPGGNTLASFDPVSRGIRLGPDHQIDTKLPIASSVPQSTDPGVISTSGEAYASSNGVVIPKPEMKLQVANASRALSPEGLMRTDGQTETLSAQPQRELRQQPSPIPETGNLTQLRSAQSILGRPDKGMGVGAGPAAEQLPSSEGNSAGQIKPQMQVSREDTTMDAQGVAKSDQLTMANVDQRGPKEAMRDGLRSSEQTEMPLGVSRATKSPHASDGEAAVSQPIYSRPSGPEQPAIVPMVLPRDVAPRRETFDRPSQNSEVTVSHAPVPTASMVGHTPYAAQSVQPLAQGLAKELGLDVAAKPEMPSAVAEEGTLFQPVEDTRFKERLALTTLNTPQKADVPQDMKQIADQLRAGLKLDRFPIEIALDPPELGQVRMMLQSNEHGTTLLILADRAETTDLMRRHAAFLHEAFAQDGKGGLNLQFGDTPQGQNEQSRASTDMSNEEDEIPADERIVVSDTQSASSVSSAPAGLNLRM